MLFYFSATGNSKRTAEIIAGRTGDRLVSISGALASGAFSYDASDDDRIGFVIPTYFYNPPKAVLRFVENLKIEGAEGKYSYVVLTLGTRTGTAGRTLAKALAEKGVDVVAQFCVRTQYTYIPSLEIPGDDELNTILDEADADSEKIAGQVEAFEKGDFTTKLSRTGIYEFDSLSITFNTMVKRIEMLVATRQEEEAKAAEAERKALESQMNPHFLFNTLSSIKALARLHGEDEIYRITIRLGKLLRYSIDNHSPDATIRESLDLVECYLMIQKLRFGERLSYGISVDDSLLDLETPKLILQPIVENAVTHGLEEKIGGWNIWITIRKTGGRLQMQVCDNGIGFQSIPDMKDLEHSQHTGLYNVYRRLELKYGGSFSLSIASRPGEGSVITIVLPLEES